MKSVQNSVGVSREGTNLFFALLRLAIHTEHYVDTDDENLLAYQLTHRERHIAWPFAHPTIRGFNNVQKTCVSNFIPIAPLR